MPTEKDLTSLIVNKVDTLATYKAMKNAGHVNPDELYSIEELNDLNLEELGANIPIQEVAPTEEYVELWIDTSEGGDILTPADIGAPTIEEAQGYANTAESNAKTYTDQQIAAIPAPDVSGQISEHNTDTSAHADIRSLVSTAQATAESKATMAEVNTAIETAFANVAMAEEASF